MITDEEYDELMKLFFSPDNTPKEQPKKNEEYKIYVAYGSNINTEQMMFRFGFNSFLHEHMPPSALYSVFRPPALQHRALHSQHR